MRFSDMYRLAWDNICRARLRTALTALGVAIGTAAVVMLVSVGNGAENVAVSRAARFGQITIVAVVPSTPATRRGAEQFHAITPDTVSAIDRLPQVTGVTGWLSLPALRLSTGGHSTDVPAIGQTPMTAAVTLATRYIPYDDGILVPSTTARALGLAPTALLGRQITLTAGGSVCCNSAAGTSTVVLGPDRHFRARVSGVYVTGSWNQPSLLTIPDKSSPLLLTQRLAATIGGQLHNMSGPDDYMNRQGYDLLYVQDVDARATGSIAARIKAMNYRIYDRADLLSEVHLVFSILTALLGIIGGVALLVAAVGIANTMIMTILERTREIGIMKALGAEPGTVRQMFLVETALVGLIGGAGGIVLAALGSVAGNVIFHAWLKGQGVTDQIGNISALSPGLVAGALLLAVIVSLLAGALPSRRAVRLQPLDALRYE